MDAAESRGPLALPAPGARDALRGLISIASRGRGALEVDIALVIIKTRLVCVLSEIEAVASSVAAAREAISERLAEMGGGESLGDSQSSGLQAAAADLTTKIAHAASTKTAALEAEAVTLEAALDRAPAIVTAALAAESSAEASPADLESATAGLESLLPVLSSDAPHELGTLRLAASDESPLGLRLVAPRAFGPDSVTLEQPPLRVRFGSHVRLILAINAPPALTEGWGDDEWVAALGHLASHTSVLVLQRSVVHDRSAPLTKQLCTAVSVDLASKCVVVSFGVPLDSPHHSADYSAAAADVVCLLRVYGHLPSKSSAGVICVPIYKGGVSPPLILPLGVGDGLMYPKPAVSGDGRIFVPVHGDIVRVWSNDGKPLSDVASRVAKRLHCVAVDDQAGTLYLGGSSTVALHLHDPSAPPKWVSSTAAPAGEDGGIAALSHLGVVIVVNHRTDTAWALRASDGAILHSMCGVVRAIHICVDPLAATLFVFDSSEPSPRYRYVHGHGFEPIDCGLHVPYSSSNFHPAAWMPATHGHPPCLVVGTWGRSEVLVLGLPGCELLRRHELRHGDLGRKICVRGLAGDPSGCALVVCDKDQRVLALPWPTLRLS